MRYDGQRENTRREMLKALGMFAGCHVNGAAAFISSARTAAGIDRAHNKTESAGEIKMEPGRRPIIDQFNERGSVAPSESQWQVTLDRREKPLSFKMGASSCTLLTRRSRDIDL